MGDRRRVSRYVVDALTVPIDATIADVEALGKLRFPVAVVGEGDVLLGAVASVATGLPGDTPVERVMIPGPGTIRPELRVDEAAEQLREDGLDHVFVTAVNGRLVGLVISDELHV